jgi:hypothetical protein
MEPGVDHLHAGIAKRAGDDLRPAVMSIQSGLGNNDPDLAP